MSQHRKPRERNSDASCTPFVLLLLVAMICVLLAIGADGFAAMWGSMGK